MSGADTVRRLRRFGLTTAIGFTLIGSLSWWRHHTIAPLVLWSAAIVLAGPALFAPALLAPVERRWLELGNAMAWFNTRLVLTALFYVVVTPIGLLIRLFHDPLERELNDAQPSYWNRHVVAPFQASNYHRQF